MGWFGTIGGRLGGGIVYAELADGRVYTLFSIAQAFSHTHEVSSAALHGRLTSTLYREQAVLQPCLWIEDYILLMPRHSGRVTGVLHTP